jgi:hypothetical protein
MPSVFGPDFLCIGMVKGGTGWLFDQLQFHPDFWMPPIKEMHYLDRDDGRGLNARDMLKMSRETKARPKGKSQAARRDWDERDVQFLKEMTRDSNNDDNLEKYANLFRFKGELISGDVTPHYGAVSARTIKAVQQYLPDTKGILLIRDPVARAWSAVSMQTRMERFDVRVLEDPVQFRQYLEKKKVHKLSYQTEVVRRWSKHAPKMQIRFFFFDDIAERPEETRHDILTFLGADPAKSSGELDADHNRKSKAKKLELTDDIKAVLVDHFREELRACAELFGGHAKKWAAQYGA